MDRLRHNLGDEKRANMSLNGRAARTAGFTLIEMLVTITLMALLMALAMPSMSAWVRNTKVRTVSNALQDGLRQSQAEALRRSRQVVFSLTNSSAPQTSLTAVANGSNWSINTVPSMTAGETSTFIEAGVLSAVGSGVQIAGPAAICFNSIGRLVANASSGVTGATCTLPTTTPPVQSYNITLTGADRPLRVLVALGGQVRMCDPAKTLSGTNPDGCP
jgi:type IV fimbrial biogenesis protein FimT